MADQSAGFILMGDAGRTSRADCWKNGVHAGPEASCCCRCRCSRLCIWARRASRSSCDCVCCCICQYRNSRVQASSWSFLWLSSWRCSIWVWRSVCVLEKDCWDAGSEKASSVGSSDISMSAVIGRCDGSGRGTCVVVGTNPARVTTLVGASLGLVLTASAVDGSTSAAVVTRGLVATRRVGFGKEAASPRAAFSAAAALAFASFLDLASSQSVFRGMKGTCTDGLRGVHLLLTGSSISTSSDLGVAALGL